MTKRHMEAGWRSFVERVLPVNTPAIQKQETRRAFYAGAAWLFDRLVNNISKGDDVTPADLEMMDDIALEFVEHAIEVKAGRR